MVSAEFKSAVSDNKLLRTRIMLKDSLVIDPTFTQFNEMLDYASVRLIGLYEPYDGEFLEPDESKWDEDLMNCELGQVVNNFSKTRIEHLKKVIAKILRPRMSNHVRNSAVSRNFEKSAGTVVGVKTTQARMLAKDPDKLRLARRKALKEISNESKRIAKFMENFELHNTWRPSDIDEVERAAEKILKNVRDYRENR